MLFKTSNDTVEQYSITFTFTRNVCGQDLSPDQFQSQHALILKVF